MLRTSTRFATAGTITTKKRACTTSNPATTTRKRARFLNADDISVLDTTSNYPNGLNLYAYCFNDPVNACDDEGNMANWLKWLIGGLAFVGAVALTVLSGGSLAPVFIGMGISIIGGGLIQGTMTALNGGSFWQGFANGAADGAFWGGIFALASAGIGAIRFTKGFRVVGLNEYDDIIKTGKFASNGFSEGKYFWASKASAKTFVSEEWGLLRAHIELLLLEFLEVVLIQH